MQLLFLTLLFAPPATTGPAHAAVQALWSTALGGLPPPVVERLHPAASVGPAAFGRLLFGAPFEGGEGIYVRVPARHACAVPEVAHALRFLAARVRQEHPGGPDMVVSDISRCGGGRFPPHRTHQSGRDVDMRYFQHGLPDLFYDYIFVDDDNFDVARVWTLVETINDHQLAQVVYMDVRHQKALHAYALTQRGYTREALKPILSWPRARRHLESLVQHVPGHHNHLHIRFHAPLAQAVGRLFTTRTAHALRQAMEVQRTGKLDHVVRRGETLGSIAEAHRVGLDQLMAWNQLNPRSVLRPGDVVEVRKR